MQAIEQSLKGLLRSLPPHPLDKGRLDSLVERTLSDMQHKASSENWKTHWEYALRDEVFTLAIQEGQALDDPETTYYDDLDDRLDVVLSFTEHDACEQVFPFNVLYDLLETQTISSCSHIFSWIEARADRLTEGMVPQKGKALVLLRTLNDLLRRLSKMGSTTLFCGRILTFLSQVFPLGERSGVNLRGEYGPAWEGVSAQKEDGTGDDAKMEGEGKADESTDAMQVDEPKAEEGAKVVQVDEKQSRKDDFYQTFWSLQLPFSKPTLFAEQATLASFKESVNKVLPVIKEATAKERALMGSKANSSTAASLKRKREPSINIEPQGQEYFFAKYLTSPELLDLEVADTHFRRQFLFQLLILLNHLLTFTKAAKATWSTTRNRSLQMDFTLDQADVQWVQETIQKTNEELRQTTPSGRAFAETVHVILEREKNWIRWKNELCAPFDKVPWAQEVEVEEADGRRVKRKLGLEDATREVRRKLREEPPDWPHELGSAPLTEIWAMGYRDLSDLQHPFQPGDIQDFVKKIKQEDARIEMRKKQLARTAERIAQARAKAAAASAAPSPAPGPGTPAPEATPATPRSGISSAPAQAPTPPLHPSLPAKPGTVTRPPEPTPAPTPAPAPAIVAPTPTPAVAIPTIVEPVLPPDDMINKYEENKHMWAWLALRTTRDQYLQHFGKIGTGDILQLAQEIENEKLEKEKALREAAANPGARDERVASPMLGSQSQISLGGSVESRAEGDGPSVSPDAETKDGPSEDVKMES